MDDLIYCFDEKTKAELLRSNYSFMCKTKYKGKDAFLFINDGKKLTFTEGTIRVSRRMVF
ncbi:MULTISPECIES: hypothetical protein [unclassified Clostridium]|uniref:hypothetical protein n=1 Tax=unclassified Clostridium TaxID=2614128 RepID=UPI0025BE1D04|nr:MULTISPECIES: hypothetical protein [unclassified Clostridium]